MVDVSSKNQRIKVAVSSKKNINKVDSSNNLAQYFQELAKNWAISETIVDNTDYSSKYYAGKSKDNANTSAVLLEQTKEEAETAISNIQDTKLAAITEIEAETINSVNTVIEEGNTQRDLLNADVSQAKAAAEEANKSAENAAQSEANAFEYKNSANSSKIAAELSETNAKQSELNAAQSEANALSYKNSAQTSSQIATEKANIAISNANEASESAMSANLSMQSANEYAEQAKAAAEEAISGQLQADFSQTDSEAKDFIKNKPTKLSQFTDDLGTSPSHSHNQYLEKNDTIKIQEITLEDYNALENKDMNTLYVVCTEFLVWGSSSWGVGRWSL